MKNLIKALAAAMALMLFAAVLSACGSDAEKKAEDAVSTLESAVSAAVSEIEGAAADLSKVDVTIESGDYAAMESFAKELQSGGNEGKVVKVTGISSRSNFGAKATVSEDDGNGKKIGVTYIITGVDSIDAYPAENAEIVITGVVTKSDNGISCHIQVPADKVEVK